MSKKRGVRTLGRERAFEALFSWRFDPPDKTLDVEKAIALRPGEDNGDYTPEALEFAGKIVAGVKSRQDELDELIERFSRNWRLERIAAVETAVLRVALFEMLYVPDIPLKVAINEAIELAKRFGDDNSGNFINGILDAVAKAIENGEFGIHKKF